MSANAITAIISAATMTNPLEALDVGFFPLERLPEPLHGRDRRWIRLAYEFHFAGRADAYSIRCRERVSGRAPLKSRHGREGLRDSQGVSELPVRIKLSNGRPPAAICQRLAENEIGVSLIPLASR